MRPVNRLSGTLQQLQSTDIDLLFDINIKSPKFMSNFVIKTNLLFQTLYLNLLGSVDLMQAGRILWQEYNQTVTLLLSLKCTHPNTWIACVCLHSKGFNNLESFSKDSTISNPFQRIQKSRILLEGFEVLYFRNHYGTLWNTSTNLYKYHFMNSWILEVTTGSFFKFAQPPFQFSPTHTNAGKNRG
jgi:hypothetical protein